MARSQATGRVRLVSAALLTLGLAGGAARAGEQRPVRASVMFNCLHASAADRAGVYADLGAAGVSWVRINVNWDGLETSSGVYSAQALASLDDCVDRARAARIHVLLDLLATPSWARGGGTTEVSPPTNPNDFAQALAYLAQHYRGRVHAWEIWNEEDHKAFWPDGSAVDYVRLLKPSYRAIKKVDPRALVVFGGTVRNDAGWLKKCYAAGAKGYFDVMATHPYPYPPSDRNVIAALAPAVRVHWVMRDQGDDKPIWFTEAGWSAPYAVTPREQAELLKKALTFTTKELPFVTNFFWFEAKNEVSSLPPSSWEGGLSLLTPDLRRRPAFVALANWIKEHPRRPRH